MKDCSIQQIGKYRNGKPKFWCKAHYSLAKSNSDNPPFQCENYLLEAVKDSEKLYLDPQVWEGGVGLWGSLKPIYCTTSTPTEQEGIHVHARSTMQGEKDIDGTFTEVYIKQPTINLFGDPKYIKLNSEIAKAYTASMVTGKEMTFIRCSHCDQPHIDSDIFAVTYHRKHLCTYCGKEFWDSVPGISNPIVEIKKIFEDWYERQAIELVDRELRISQNDFPGGIEIWGSNPAIIWTRGRKEEAGIHVHVYKHDGSGNRLFDDTYGTVVIDDLNLNVSQVRYLMVQNSMNHLIGKISAIKCPRCNCDHFDSHDLAIRPHSSHICEFCKDNFETKIECVSNPMVSVINQLLINYDGLQKK
ncbi:hypothetical protein [Gelidibacter japonicus]|uniref:hypothetical protein n=1 Tax=Gelidibacter japonicus TaxID=1962232 RepID=UPI003A8D3D24